MVINPQLVPLKAGCVALETSADDTLGISPVFQATVILVLALLLDCMVFVYLRVYLIPPVFLPLCLS